MQSLIKTEKSFYSNMTNNKNEKRNKLHTSIMSISMKSLDNIKNEINQRKEQNLHRIEEMYRRNGLNYDYLKEREIREKILDEYYKEKEQKIAEGKLQLEQEKRKREEEFQKLKIRKVNGLKYTSIPKKPQIFSKIINEEIQFSSVLIPIKSSIINNNSSEKKETNNPNDLNLTFRTINNSVELNKSQSNNYKNDNNNKVPNDKQKETGQKIFDNKKQSIFEDYNKKNKDQEKTIDIKQKTQENETTKNEPSLFSVFPSGSPFNLGNTSTTKPSPSPFFPKINFTENKKEEKEIKTDEKNKEPQQQQQQKESDSLFSTTSTFKFNLGKNNKDTNIFTAKAKNEDKSIFFFNNPINIKNDNNKIESGIFAMKKDEGGIFNQHSSVSKTMNDQFLFTSNQPNNKEQKSLLNASNPFTSPQGGGQTSLLFG